MLKLVALLGTMYVRVKCFRVKAKLVRAARVEII